MLEDNRLHNLEQQSSNNDFGVRLCTLAWFSTTTFVYIYNVILVRNDSRCFNKAKMQCA